MIELKPYRGTTASTIEKGDKTRLAGEMKTGAQAYPWHENSTILMRFGCGMIVGLLVAILLLTITATPIWLCFYAIGAVAAIFIINAWWQNYLNQYVGQPTLLVSSEHARRADEIEVRFLQPVRRDMVIEKATIEFIAREWVRYKCGTDTCTTTHDIEIQTRTDNKPRTIAADTAYEKSTTLTVPAKAMHSFAFSDNSLTWIIRVTVWPKDFMKLSESYAIQVTPEIHTYD